MVKNYFYINYSLVLYFYLLLQKVINIAMRDSIIYADFNNYKTEEEVIVLLQNGNITLLNKDFA